MLLDSNRKEWVRQVGLPREVPQLLVPKGLFLYAFARRSMAFELHARVAKSPSPGVAEIRRILLLNPFLKSWSARTWLGDFENRLAYRSVFD
jgi:hypothetical protein